MPPFFLSAHTGERELEGLDTGIMGKQYEWKWEVKSCFK
jgi:hypothetical protein